MRQSKDIDGWLIIDKPSGLTSSAVVSTVKRLTKACKVGHSGTLDPIATGVLPIAIGQATKTVQYVMDGLKHYQFIVKWGEERDTDDSQGKVIAVSDKRPSTEAIIATLPTFIGKIEQVPPRFSAIKLDGQRSYKKARSNEEGLVLLPRQVYVQSFTLVSRLDADQAQFEVHSGKGAYMRALARDLARALGTTGHISQLRRTVCGPFLSSMAIFLDKLKDMEHTAMILQNLLPVVSALTNVPAFAVSKQEAYYLSSGRPIPVLRALTHNTQTSLASGAAVRVVADGKIVALARVDNNMLIPMRIFNTVAVEI